jgi:hypothetical protein
LETFNSTWLIGLVAFGIHLILVGALLVTTRIAPRALGLVLIAAGVAYVVDTLAHSVLGSYADHESLFLAIVVVPSVIGEGWFGLWLLRRAARSPIPDRSGSSSVPARIAHVGHL